MMDVLKVEWSNVTKGSRPQKKDEVEKVQDFLLLTAV